MALRGGGTPPSKRFRKTDTDSGLRTCIALIVVSLVMFTLSVREGEAGGFFTATRGVWMTVTTPLRWAGGAAVAPFQGLSNVVTNLTADQERLSDLKAENERLQARNAELEEQAAAAERLTSLLGLQSYYNLQSTAARIVSGSTDSWSSTVTLDKGSAAGIAVGMPVTDGNGAIGQVVRCGATSATVRLITDENSSVAAMVQVSRAQGVLRGSVDGTLRLTLVRTDQMVEKGDMVVTSGLGGVFPKGLPLGKVIAVEHASGSLYYDITVEPLSSTESFEEVLVITSLTEEQKATSEDVAEADQQDASSKSSASAGADATTGQGDAAAEADGQDADGLDVDGDAESQDGLGDGDDGEGQG